MHALPWEVRIENRPQRSLTAERSGVSDWRRGAPIGGGRRSRLTNGISEAAVTMSRRPPMAFYVAPVLSRQIDQSNVANISTSDAPTRRRPWRPLATIVARVQTTSHVCFLYMHDVDDNRRNEISIFLHSAQSRESFADADDNLPHAAMFCAYQLT